MNDTYSFLSKIRAIIASLFILGGSILLGYDYGYTNFDWEVVLSFFYITGAFLIVEKKITLSLLQKLYKNSLYDKLSILLFLLASFLLYDIGYKYNFSLIFQRTFGRFILSALIGVTFGITLILVSSVYELLVVVKNERTNIS